MTSASGVAVLAPQLAQQLAPRSAPRPAAPGSSSIALARGPQLGGRRRPARPATARSRASRLGERAPARRAAAERRARPRRPRRRRRRGAARGRGAASGGPARRPAVLLDRPGRSSSSGSPRPARVDLVRPGSAAGRSRGPGPARRRRARPARASTAGSSLRGREQRLEVDAAEPVERGALRRPGEQRLVVVLAVQVDEPLAPARRARPAGRQAAVDVGPRPAVGRHHPAQHDLVVVDRRSGPRPPPRRRPGAPATGRPAHRPAARWPRRPASCRRRSRR